MDPRTGDTQDELVLKVFEYRDALLAYAYTFLHDWALAEDALQETLMVVLKKRNESEPIRNLYGWVRRILFNKTMELLRARRHETTAEQEQLETAVAEALDQFLAEQDAAHMRQMRRALEECMSGLNKTALEMLAGFYWRRQSCEQLASLFKRSVNAVKLALSRTRKQLRGCMQVRLAALDAE
ncbi:MAG: sigma-70 family RNA polymerase sigma factor [Kiritimatiellae bacterium]|nr:sigma-70 family RNA polymerase sigma factor [Kiritimatiellia bacterium]